MTIGTNYSQMQFNYEPSMYGQAEKGPGAIYTGPTVVATDSFSSNGGDNTCTDGKDDGKIGFFSALGNAVQGIGKTIVNGVKGMFTNKEGKFSLGKTLLSAAGIALCVAVPAVGVAACAVGGVMGAVQVGKGIGNAVTAKTDAEAKQAWEDIGGGTFTVAASVVGAKAGVKAVKSTSTATNGLASLGKNATTGQKVAAFSRDMVSSTKNGVSNIKNVATTKFTDFSTKAKAKYADLKANPPKLSNVKAKAGGYYEALKIKYAEAKAAGIDPNSALTPDELSLLKQIDARRAFAADDTLSALDKIDDITNAASGLKSKAPSFADAKATATNALKHPLETSKTAWNSAMKTIKGLNKQTVKNLASKLSQPAKNAWEAISTGKYSYQEAVNKYGYDSVAEVVKMMGGYIFAEDLV